MKRFPAKSLSHTLQCGLTLLCLTTAGTTYGQTPARDGHRRLMTDSVYQIGEVVSLSTRNLTPNQTISREQIDGLPSNNVSDALKYLAGVQIKDYGGLGGQKTVNVRSLGSQHVGVYLDGVRITNAQNGTVDLGKYSLSTLESVSLYNANKTELLMTASEYASASTVYLRTRRPDSTCFTASYGNGSFGTHHVNLNLSYKCLGFIDAQYTHSDGDYKFRYHTEYEDTTGRRRNGDIDQMRVEGCAFLKDLQWHTYYYMSYRGLPGGVVRRLSDRYTDVGREWDRNFFTQLTYQHRFDAFGVRALAKYTNDHLHYRSDYDNNISVHANNRYHQQDAYGAAAASYTLRDLSLSLSSDLRWSDLTCDVKRFSYVYRMDSKTSLSAFYKWRGLSLNATGLYTYCRDHTSREADPLERFTWNVMANYALGKFNVRTFYKSVFRVPTLNDLYYTLVGNRNLKPEYTRQLDIGMTYTADWLRVQLDGYWNQVRDRIVCLPLKGSFQWTMLNFGRTRNLGADLSVNATLKHRIGTHSANSTATHVVTLSGTYQDDRNRTDPESDDYNDLVAYSPRWSFSAIYTFLWRGFSISVSDMFVDKRYWTAENAVDDPLDAYNCTDIKVGYAYKWWAVEMECQNVFDKPYEVIVRWPMPGRRYMTTLKINI